jgi:hypothetical protein
MMKTKEIQNLATSSPGCGDSLIGDGDLLITRFCCGVGSFFCNLYGRCLIAISSINFSLPSSFESGCSLLGILCADGPFFAVRAFTRTGVCVVESRCSKPSPTSTARVSRETSKYGFFTWSTLLIDCEVPACRHLPASSFGGRASRKGLSSRAAVWRATSTQICGGGTRIGVLSCRDVSAALGLPMKLVEEEKRLGGKGVVAA